MPDEDWDPWKETPEAGSKNEEPAGKAKHIHYHGAGRPVKLGTKIKSHHLGMPKSSGRRR